MLCLNSTDLRAFRENFSNQKEMFLSGTEALEEELI